MLDDFDFDVCNGKHHGPTLHSEGDFTIMRCTFCEQIIRNPIKSTPEEKEAKRKSSRTCVSACDWVADDKLVRCRSCSYVGPLLPNGACDQTKL